MGINMSSISSMINVPPTVAVTVFWVAVGFGLCWWLTGKRKGIRES
jgi:hypothetical protein